MWEGMDFGSGAGMTVVGERMGPRLRGDKKGEHQHCRGKYGIGSSIRPLRSKGFVVLGDGLFLGDDVRGRGGRFANRPYGGMGLGLWIPAFAGMTNAEVTG